MRCPTPEQLEQFLNDSLTELDISAVAAHIDGCVTCQLALDGVADSGVFADGSAAEQSDSSALTGTDEDAVLELIARIRNAPEDTLMSPDMATGGSIVADSTLDLPGRLGGYELLKVVGEGATGRLYRALDLALDRIVAVKTLKSELAAIPSARARFEREARACAALAHDNIVAVHQVDPGSDGEPPYLVMEFIAGGSLQERIRGDRRAGMRQCVEWIRQAAHALQAAHDAGIVHRDVKPSNLLIDASSDRLRVADFGLARLVESEERLTAEGMIAGTPAYMSPEQIVNPAAVTGLTDIYSLGVVLYEALSGELPFRGTVRMVLNQVLHEDPIPPGRLNDRIPRDLEIVCLKAMSRERPLRYQSAGAFAEDLERWLDDRPVLARPIGPPRKLWRWSRRNPRLAAGATLVLALLAAGAVDWSRILTSDVWQQIEKQRALAVEYATAVEEERHETVMFARTLLRDVDTNLQPVPQTLRARVQLLEAIARDLRRVPEGSDHFAAAQRTLMVVQSHCGLALLQLGELKDAGAYLGQAEQLARQETSSDNLMSQPERVLIEVLLHRTDLQTRLAELDSREERSFQLNKALELCDEAISRSELQMQAAAQATLGETVRSEWLKAGRRHCAARQRRGDILERLERANLAGTEYLAALATLSGLEVAFPDAMSLQRDIGVLHLKLATLAVASQRDPLEHFQNAYKRYSTVNNAASTPQTQEDLAFTCEQLVSSLLGREDYPEAARIASEECDLRRALLAGAPHDNWRRRQFGECTLRLGTIEGHQGHWDRAEQAVTAAVEQFELLLQQNPPLLVDRVLRLEADLVLATGKLALKSEDISADVASIEQNLRKIAESIGGDTDEELRNRIEQLLVQCRELHQASAN